MTSEEVMRCPRDLAENTPGFALDFGGSVVKIIYRSKDDAKDLAQNKESKTGNLRLKAFTRENLSQGVEFLRENCDIKRSDGEPTNIFTTGIGCSQYKTLIEKSLNVKMSNITEMDCFVKAFGYLRANLPSKEFIHEDMEEQILAMENEMAQTFAAMANVDIKSESMDDYDFNIEPPKWKRTQLSTETPLPESDTFPCMLAMLGSAFGLMKVDKDGSFEIVDMSNRGGRQFLGLGSLLTGAKSYGELISLAEKGDIAMASTTVRSLKGAQDADKSDDNVYNKMLDMDVPDQLVFSFGNAVGKKLSDFKPSDLARSLLHTMILDLTQFISQTMEQTGVNKLFISGGFTVPDLVKQIFTSEYVRRGFNPLKLQTDIEFHFLKQGQSLGTIGAYINNIDQFLATPAKHETEKIEKETKDSHI